MRALAFYLPQFHPIPENDEWWGKGFTEWTNVAKRTPLFNGHHQPHLPADLGHYDLRCPETRIQQAELAKQYGLHGFCYYHYWFEGKRLLQRPFEETLQSGQPDFPFCLCWANETWSRRWIGEERDVLMKQSYSEDDDRKHGTWLTQAFQDPRYIRVGDRPLFLIYRPHDLPEPERFAETLAKQSDAKSVARPFLVGVDAHRCGFDFRELGLDATLGFEPQLAVSGATAFQDGFKWSKLLRNLKYGIIEGRLKIFDEATERAKMAALQRHPETIPCSFVSWDNSARRGRDGIIYHNASPHQFYQALKERIQLAKGLPEERQFVFINAWNEWAEGNHLEPDQRYGHQYLEAMEKALNESD